MDNILSPAPISRYLEILQSFVTSFSFPIFVIYLLMVSQCRRWKRLTEPLQDFGKIMFVYNIVISLINVYCFWGFMLELIRADSIYDRTHSPQLRKVYYLYWVTKVYKRNKN
jgi:hypothetical protein